MEAVAVKKSVDYKCECCGTGFVSNRNRTGEKLCVVCVELRRALKGFVKRGLSEATIANRAKKLLGIGTKKES